MDLRRYRRAIFHRFFFLLELEILLDQNEMAYRIETGYGRESFCARTVQRTILLLAGKSTSFSILYISIIFS